MKNKIKIKIHTNVETKQKTDDFNLLDAITLQKQILKAANQLSRPTDDDRKKRGGKTRHRRNSYVKSLLRTFQFGFGSAEAAEELGTTTMERGEIFPSLADSRFNFITAAITTISYR